jgi:hypothetical protein
MVIGETEHLIQPDLEGLAGVVGGVDPTPQMGAEQLRVALVEGADCLFLSFEMTVERTCRQSRLFEDIGHRGIMASVPVQNLKQGDQESVAFDIRLIPAGSSGRSRYRM